MVFLTFNGKLIHAQREGEGRGPVWEAVKQTVTPSFWSSTCAFLGFISLLLVRSTPMRYLGIAGSKYRKNKTRFRATELIGSRSSNLSRVEEGMLGCA